MLFIFGGLPAVGKSELSIHLARILPAVHLRVDTIEQAMRERDITVNADQGYLIAYRVAADNLRLGLNVVSDSVNPLDITRQAWRQVAQNAGCDFVEMEIVCSDEREHRQRVETRESSIAGLKLPDWQAIVDREYHEWTNGQIVIDTAHQSPTESKAALERALKERNVRIRGDEA